MPTKTRNGQAVSRNGVAPWKDLNEAISAPWASAGLRAMKAWSQSCAAFVDGAGKIAAELTEFAAKTNEANANAWRTAMRFDGDFEKLFTEPNNLAAAVSRNCYEEASKVAHLMADTGHATWAPLGSLLPGTTTLQKDN
jgi:hypothetical protein